VSHSQADREIHSYQEGKKKKGRKIYNIFPISFMKHIMVLHNMNFPVGRL